MFPSEVSLGEDQVQRWEEDGTNDEEDGRCETDIESSDVLSPDESKDETKGTDQRVDGKTECDQELVTTGPVLSEQQGVNDGKDGKDGDKDGRWGNILRVWITTKDSWLIIFNEVQETGRNLNINVGTTKEAVNQRLGLIHEDLGTGTESSTITEDFEDTEKLRLCESGIHLLQEKTDKCSSLLIKCNVVCSGSCLEKGRSGIGHVIDEGDELNWSERLQETIDSGGVRGQETSNLCDVKL